MILDILLEYAIGDIRSGVMEPNQSSEWRMVYYDANPTLNSMLDVMDDMVDVLDSKRIYPTRYIRVPLGHTLIESIEHIANCSNSMYKQDLTYEMVSASDWFRDSPSRRRTPVSSAMGLRTSLLRYIQNDHTHPRLDEYVCNYLNILVWSIMDAAD